MKKIDKIVVVIILQILNFAAIGGIIWILYELRSPDDEFIMGLIVGFIVAAGSMFVDRVSGLGELMVKLLGGNGDDGDDKTPKLKNGRFQ